MIDRIIKEKIKEQGVRLMRTEFRMMKGMCHYMCMCEMKNIQMKMCGSDMHGFNMKNKNKHNMC